jgi:predicted nucleic acid-binding protein
LSLAEVPRGARVFLDSGIFLNHFAGTSAECRQLLERCERAEVRGATSALVLAEVAHRLAQLEAAVRRELAPGESFRPPADLVGKIPLMGVEIRPLDLRVLLAAGGLGSRAGLGTAASLAAAGARDAGCDQIATVEPGLEAVEGLRVYRPSDLEP